MRHPRVLNSACLIFILVAMLIYPLAHAAPGNRGALYIGIHTLLTVLGWVVWRVAQRCEQRSMRWVLLTGVLTRLLLIPAPPLTSHDIQRYLWDGKIALAGFNPYTTAAGDAAVAHLREDWPTPNEHLAYPTLYPPGALGLFSLAAAGPVWAFWCWKGMATAASSAYWLLMARPCCIVKTERWMLRGSPSTRCFYSKWVLAAMSIFLSPCASP
ncbi:MAG: hypothetical protein R3C68_02205 [Myxococcota bacterium]